MSSIVVAGDVSGSVTIAAPSAAGSTTLTLPSTSGTFVTDSATQTLTNKTLTSPTLTTPALGTPASGTLTNCTGLPLSTGVTGSLAASSLPAGSVLQVLQGTKTDAFTTTSTSFTIPTGLSVSITPSSSSSKFFIICYTNFAVSGDNGHTYARLQRDGTGLNVADAASSRPVAAIAQNNYGEASPPNFSLCYLDSPATTSAITYSFGIRSSNGTTVYLNRSPRDADAGTYDGRSSSAIIVMEVKG